MSYHIPSKNIHQNEIIPDSITGKRLDQALSILFPSYSRSQLQKWLKQGKILIDNQIKQAKEKIYGGEEIKLKIQIPLQTANQAEKIPLNIIYEDKDIIVINKPINFVVHPGIGNLTGTLLNALLAYHSAFQIVPRAGIVHRLDKDTSGLIVAAKTLTAYSSLIKQLFKRKITREYEAITAGYITLNKFTIKNKIRRSSYNRLKMAISPIGKEAITHFSVLERYHNDYYARVRCQLETGRTHQIRVHMQSLGAPIIGDQLYNRRIKIHKDISEISKETLKNFNRQALHAYRLIFTQPTTGKKLEFTSKPPKDMQNLIQTLRND